MGEPAKRILSLTEALAQLRDAMLAEARSAAKDEVQSLMGKGAANTQKPTASLEYLTKRQVAELLQLTPRTITNLIKRGLPHEYAGRDLRFKADAVRAWMARHKPKKV